MFKLLLSSVFYMALLLASSGARAQIYSSTAEALMHSSGMWEQLASIALHMRTGILHAISQSGASVDQAEKERLSNILNATYSADNLRAIALGVLKKNVEANHVPALQRWYATEVGITITKLEKAASAGQTDPQAILQQGEALLGSMPAHRRALLEELVAVTMSAEVTSEIVVNAALAAQRGIMSVQPNVAGPSQDEFRAVLAEQQSQMLEAFKALSLASYAMAYTTLSTVDLEQYVEFLKSDAGRHFTAIGVKAFNAALVKTSEAPLR